MPNPKAIGETSEAVVLAHLMKSGLSVSIPFGNNQRYDLVVDRGDHFERVQVKTGRIRRGCLVFRSVSTNGFTKVRTNYRGSADTFMVYCPDTEEVFSFPVEECGNGNTYFRVVPPAPGSNTSKIRYAVDYKI